MTFEQIDAMLREMRAQGRRVVFRGDWTNGWWLEVQHG